MTSEKEKDETDALGFGFLKSILKPSKDLQIEDLDDEEVPNKEVYKTRVGITREEMLSDTYKMDYPRRGKALIFNNKTFAPHLVRRGYGERNGTDVDASRICKRLQILGFQVDKHQDVTADKMLAILDEYSQDDHSDADCFVCVLLSHGEPDVIFGYDDQVQLTSIFQKFQGKNCPSLAGKPKIFIIQACRGWQFDKGVEMTVARDVVDSKRDFDTAFPPEEIIRIPDEADFLIAQSTVPGHYSWRNGIKGSWYIQALVDILDEYGASIDILRLLTYVNRKVAYDFESSTNMPSTTNMKQVPAFTSRLTKDLYFHPKQ